MSEAITKNDIHELIDYFDSRFDQINHKFDQIDHKFEQIDRKFEQIDRKFEQIDRKFEDMFKNQNQVISKINKKMDTFGKTITQLEYKLDILYQERKENSILIEKDVNNYVERYLSQKYLYSQVINLKPKLTESSQQLYQKINNNYSLVDDKTQKFGSPLLNITDRNSLLLYPAKIDKTITTNPITGVDGLFLVSYKDYIKINEKTVTTNVSELFLVEAKMSFTIKHLQEKLDKFKQIKELLTAPRNEFTFPEYRNLLSEHLRYADRISIFYATPDWTFNLTEFSLRNNEIIPKPVTPSNYRDQYNYHQINKINQLYDDSKVIYSLLDRPDLRFLKKGKKDYIGYNELESISGGSSMDDEID